MSTHVTLTAKEGPLAGRKFVFGENTLCTLGRSHDCQLCLTTEVPDLTISRRHCLLEIDSPSVRVHDLGSRNGTYINGEKVGQRTGMRPQEVPTSTLPRTLCNGDLLRVGTIVFHVAIESDDVDVEGEEPAEESADRHGAVCC
ncbi:MAG: FHA domain-containing protein [Planctomycetes bacterium]|nr:FHA domain-containing protein [Planctomycetota bacterium]